MAGGGGQVAGGVERGRWREERGRWRQERSSREEGQVAGGEEADRGGRGSRKSGGSRRGRWREERRRTGAVGEEAYGGGGNGVGGRGVGMFSRRWNVYTTVGGPFPRCRWKTRHFSGGQDRLASRQSVLTPREVSGRDEDDVQYRRHRGATRAEATTRLPGAGTTLTTLSQYWLHAAEFFSSMMTGGDGGQVEGHVSKTTRFVVDGSVCEQRAGAASWIHLGQYCLAAAEFFSILRRLRTRVCGVGSRGPAVRKRSLGSSRSRNKILYCGQHCFGFQRFRT